METMIMRLLSLVTRLDVFGDNHPGLYWALTKISAQRNSDNEHLPIPFARQAVLAIQPIDVIQIDVPANFDSFQNENGEPEMKQAGYLGNVKRRAVPIVVVRYATTCPGLGTTKVIVILASLLDTSEGVNSQLKP
jgi:hypothetical protein